MKEEFIPEFFHTYNRGVEKRKIFLNKEDSFRGIHDIYEFNDVSAVINVNYRAEREQIYGYRIPIDRRPRELLIDIMAWCLMPNHYHFFSREKRKDGLSKFQQKFGIGFTNYFNLKYDRSGVLFQGKYKKVRVLDNDQACHLICYIHSNLLDLWKPNWKEEGLSSLDIQAALKFLESEQNRWSSHRDYWGIKNFPSLINNEFLSGFFGGSKGYREFFTDWLKQYERNSEIIQKIIID